MRKIRIKEPLIRFVRSSFGEIAAIRVREFWNNHLTKSGKIEKGLDGYTISKGNSKGDKFAVIRMEIPLMGIGNVIRARILAQPAAEKYGYRLISYYSTKRSVRNDKQDEWAQNNLFERYYIQKPTLENVLKEKNNRVIALECNRIGLYDPAFFKELNGNQNDHDMKYISGKAGNPYRATLHDIAVKHLFLRREFEETVSIQKKELFRGIPLDKTVAVLMREHMSKAFVKGVKDEKAKHVASYHQCYYSIKKTIDEIIDVFNSWGGEYMYLSTMFESTINEFKRRVGEDRVIYIDRIRYKELEDSFNDVVEYETVTEGELEKLDSYMLEQYLMSECSYFISYECGGGWTIPLIKDGIFEDIYYLKPDVKYRPIRVR